MDWDQTFATRAKTLTASEIRELLKLINQPDIISFAGGIPDPALFPYDKMADAYARIFADPVKRAEALQYSISEGYVPLRRWLAEHLAELGIATHADNILILNGSQQALEFLGKLFLSPGDRVIVTNPAYLGALQAFSLYEPTYVTVTLDDDGVDLKRLEEEFRKGAKFFYLTPDFGNPSGVTLTLEQRHAILDLAYRYNVPVVEDTAYEKLRYDGVSQPSLMALDTGKLNESAPLSAATGSGHVIYCGTFSKSIAPALRIGWVVAPSPVIQKLVLMKQASDLHSSTLNQMVMYEVAKDIIADHAEVLRGVYRARRDAMLAALEKYMPAGLHWTRPEGGMFVWMTLPEGLDGAELLAESIEKERVAFVPGSAFYPDRSVRNTIRFAFSLSTPEKIDIGIRRLAGLIAAKME
jgi:DNA-binding transcriptional MocR family regulator